MMDVFRIIVILMASLGIAECYCYTKTLYASTFSGYKSVYYSSYDYCTIYISPSSLYSGSSNYYLQISWSSFSVKGDMPTCSKDYVQVYLTRSYKSIGKYCSSNAAMPFTMYSHDGYAKITYNADSSWNGYFAFRYELKSKSSELLGSAYQDCPNSYQSSHSSEVYSRNWPKQYTPSSSPCTHTIYRSSLYDVTKVVFMDLDLNTSPYPGDCIELRGSNISSSYWTHTIDTRICSSSSIKTYTVYDRYIQIKFNRKYGSSSYRGFVAGYVSYDLEKKDEPSPKTKSSSGTSIISTTVIRILVPAVVLGVVVLVFLKYRARMRARNANHFGGGVTVPAPQTNIITTSTVTANASINRDGVATNYPPSGYPKSNDPVAAYAPPSYPVTSAYPPASTPYPNQSYPPPAYEFTAKPISDGTVPAYPSYPTSNAGYPTENQEYQTGNLANQTGNPGFLTGNQVYPATNSGYPADNNTVSGCVTLPPTSGDAITFTAQGAQQQSIIPPIEQNNAAPNAMPTVYPNAPPPVYPNAPPPAYSFTKN